MNKTLMTATFLAVALVACTSETSTPTAPGNTGPCAGIEDPAERQACREARFGDGETPRVPVGAVEVEGEFADEVEVLKGADVPSEGPPASTPE